MKKRLSAIFINLALLTACSTTSGSNPVIDYSGFDKAKTVFIAPHANACTSMICTGIGAQWNESNPDQALLIIAVFNDYTSIRSVKLRINDEVHVLAAAKGITEFSNIDFDYKESTRAFVIPTTIISKLIQTDDAWLRVETPTGYIEDPIIEGKKDSKAFHALKRFIEAIKS